MFLSFECRFTTATRDIFLIYHFYGLKREVVVTHRILMNRSMYLQYIIINNVCLLNFDFLIALKKNSRWHSGAKVNHSAQHATRTTQPLTESQKWDRPVWSRSKSAGVGSSAGLGRSSSTLVLNEDLSGDDQSLMRATSERNVSELAVSHAPHASTLPDFSPGPGPLHLAAK